jgi:NADH-quinone oxidoreductase subunit N
MSYLHLLRLAAPETIVVLAALAVLTADLGGLRELELRFRFGIGAMIAGVGCLAAIAWILVFPDQADYQGGIFVVDPLTRLVKIGLLILTIFTLVISADATFTPHAGEYFALILLATLGMMFLVSSEDILVIFLALELTSLPLYILTAFNKRNAKSAEAALKYFLFGGMAAAVTLFGLSLLYTLSGSTHLTEIAQVLAAKGITAAQSSAVSVNRAIDPLLVLGLVMTVIGFGFKIAAVPFHLWAPDAYEGAPAPSAALIASGSKLASFFVLAKVMWLGLAGAGGSGAWLHFQPGWMPVLAMVAAASMVLGNFAAVVQGSVRRLLAYSAVAHAGYMLLGVIAGGGQNLAALLYYALTYALATVGAFGVVSIVEAQTGGDRLSDFAGLGRSRPFLSSCLLVFILSLAGIPPLAGFFGKFYLFSSALAAGSPNLGLLWLVILALTMSTVSLYYYLQVLKQAYVVPPALAPGPCPSVPLQTSIALLAIAVVALGCAPGLLVNPLTEAVRLAGFLK